MPTRTSLEAKMIRRRLKGLTVAPARTAPTKDKPLGRRLDVTTAWRKPGSWAAGYHTGEDYACAAGSQAVATCWGRVIATGTTTWGSAYGTMVILRSSDGRYDIGYCHLSVVRVQVGDRVRPGTVLGLTGNTGRSTGPHLHFEVRTAGGRYKSDVDPMRTKRRAR